MEQGSIPALTGDQHHASYGSDVSFNQGVTPSDYWPWVANATYYLRIVNSGSSNAPVTLAMDGKNAVTEDEDQDGLPDAWERTFFGGIYGQNGAGDFDNDGISNAVEFSDGTDPTDIASAKYVLSVASLNGVASRSPNGGRVNRGIPVTFNNTPNSGYRFAGWNLAYAQPTTSGFGLRATGTVTIPTGGVYSFGVSYTGDVQLRVSTGTLISSQGSRDYNQQRYGHVNLAAGTHPVELVFSDYRDWNNRISLFAAPGKFTAHDASFRLIGDVANGGLVVHTLAGGTSTAGFTVTQVAAGQGVSMNTVADADALLAGTLQRRAESAMVLPMVHFAGRAGQTETGAFVNASAFPMQLPQPSAPLTLTALNDLTATALNTIPLVEALDAGSLVLGTADVPWLGEKSDTAFDKVDHAYSAPIGDDQASSLTMMVNGPGTVSFRWKVSSEQWSDYLQFQVNESTQQQISGENDWAEVVYTVAEGPQRLRWRYAKDGNGAAGQDRAWLDTLRYNPTNHAPTIGAVALQTLAASGPSAPIAFTVGDTSGADGLTVSGTSSNTAFIPDSAVVISGTGANRTVTLTPSRPDGVVPYHADCE
jgi:hypothetical protein